MALLVTGAELGKAISESTFIQGGDVTCAEGVKYDFRLSSRILKAKFGRPVNYEELTGSEKTQMVVDPGEVVFVLTEERLVLPMDMLAQLSPKRKLSHAGILTLGGFCVDPGYEGRLLLGLVNLSSTSFPIRPGKKLIAATFHRLEESESGDFPKPAGPFDDFPDELVQVMQKYSPIAIQTVSQGVEELQKELAELRSEIRSHENWYNRFKDLLDRHNEQIGKIADGLTEEIESRKTGQHELTQAVQSINKTFAFLKGAAWVMGAILSVATAVFVGWVTGFFS